MKLYNRILSTFLAVILMLGSLTSLIVIEASAADISTTADAIHAQYVKEVFNTPEEKLASMKHKLTRGDYKLYVDEISGEIAMQNTVTGDILFSNPYDVAASKGSSDTETGTKNEILSQVVVKYTANGATATLNSFKDAAMRGQIVVQNIKNGIRVEYTIGQDESRKLIPRQISEINYLEMIDAPMQDARDKGELDSFSYEKFKRMFEKKSLEAQRTDLGREKLLEDYPICAKMNIYILKPTDSTATLNWIESLIKAFCEDYTFEQMEADHEETGYVAKDEKYPLFRMALEYYLDETGLVVSMPCNGLRYDMSAYTLENFSILPYIGAGNYTNDGYNFFPDGSGALFDFKQLNPNATSYISGKIYGVDYAYHTISGTYERVIRYPVYGSVAQEKIYSFSFTTTYKLDENHDLVKQNGEPVDTGIIEQVDIEVSNTVMSKEDILKYVADRFGTMLTVNGAKDGIAERSYKRGYVAVIEAGESLAELESYQGGSNHNYNTLRNFFNPKPKDTYTLEDSLSVTGTSSWTVVSERKYTGEIKIHYQMLSDPEKAIEVNGETKTVADSGMKYYETTWLGMAEAYRDRMVDDGTLTKLTEADLEKDIPLYIEVFGALLTQQTIATIPVNVMTPLTTFENVYDMYKDLADENVNNINFKMTGFANGGMYATVPAGLKWEKKVGGKDGFRELLKQAAEVNKSEDKNLGLYPDFDFAYIYKNTSFDSTNLKKDALKTIDNRYSSKRQYSATQQTYVTFYQLAMAPARYSKFYEKLLDNLADYDIKSISVGSLGNSLNSDFDEDDPYNREDNKDYTVQAFQDMKNAGYSLMTDSANAYTWGYVDHILNVDLDSSRYVRSSASVPFIGAVLHGYVQFAGAAFNEEGDTDYALLRAIENGAGLYFILSYQNTHELKEDIQLSQYYSIRYDIWKKDVVSYYTKLNELLRDVQDKVIIDHDFLIGDRVLDADELEEELENQLKDEAQKEQDKQNAIETEKTLYFANAWKTIETSVTQMNKLLNTMRKTNDEIADYYSDIVDLVEKQIPKTIKDIELTMQGFIVEDEITEKELSPEKLVLRLNTQISAVRTATIGLLKACASVEKLYADGATLLEDVVAAQAIVASADADTIPVAARDKMVAQGIAYYNQAKALYDTQALGLLNSANAYRTEGNASYVFTKALALTSPVNEILTTLKNDTEFFEEEDLEDACQGIEDLMKVFNKDALLEAGKPEEDKAEEDDDQNVGNTSNKYVVDNNLIVAVTYGTRDDNGVKTAYKSFILNYNNYAVTVTRNGVVYTIASGGYVVIEH